MRALSTPAVTVEPRPRRCSDESAARETRKSKVHHMAAGKGRKLVIVESPAKAKTIAGYLGGDFEVEASVGHIRDLPNPSELPAAMKKGPFGKFAVDVDNGFEPYYVVDPDKKKKVAELKRLLNDAREIDTAMVDAQETRRILDRLYGYEVSPVLWRKVRQGLSAGRVQSVATRLVVERERERMAFVAAEYWDVSGTFSLADKTAEDADKSFDARLVQFGGARVASG